MVDLFPFQADLMARVSAAWSPSARVVMAVSPTGSGKTVMFSHAIQSERGASVAIAHRQELVSQMSLALARNGVRHGIVGPPAVVRRCVSLHMDDLKRSYYDPRAKCRVAGVDTLVRLPTTDPWFNQVSLMVGDEGHHFLRDNKWGKAAAMFPNARGLLVTATPCRADGKGLGRHADGIVDAMVVGPTMRELINTGYLTDYRIFAPPSDVDLTGVQLSAGGDYSPVQVRAAVHKASRIVGDVVETYLKHAKGRLGVTFAVDIESAGELAAAYRAAGVPAEVVSAKTPDLMRAHVLRRFRNREVLQLVNVDLFGEGFDLPAIECVSFARPTASYGLYVQQFGRALRRLEGKDVAYIFDHVGNTVHGLPDKARTWSLNARERAVRGAASDLIPTRTCLGCTYVYEAFHKACPNCKTVHAPPGRSTPDQVDGDLEELLPDVLAVMRGEVERIDRAPPLVPGLDGNAQRHLAGVHRQRQCAQREVLRPRIELFGRLMAHKGHDTAEAHRLFYFRYGVDVLSAHALNTKDALALAEQITTTLRREGVEV